MELNSDAEKWLPPISQSPLSGLISLDEIPRCSILLSEKIQHIANMAQNGNHLIQGGNDAAG
jgi:hypothetical protein